MPGEIDIYKDGTRVGRAQGIDFKTGSNIVLAGAKDIGNSQIDMTITAVSLELLRIQGLGLVGQTFDRSLCSNSAITVDGTVYLVSVPLIAGTVCTNWHITATTTSTGVTNAKGGLYDSSYSLLASTADTPASFATSGLKTLAFTTAYTVPTSGLYYLAFWGKTGTSMPTFARGWNDGNGTASIGAGTTKSYTSQTGQSDLPATLTASASGIAYWMGIS